MWCVLFRKHRVVRTYMCALVFVYCLMVHWKRLRIPTHFFEAFTLLLNRVLCTNIYNYISIGLCECVLNYHNSFMLENCILNFFQTNKILWQLQPTSSSNYASLGALEKFKCFGPWWAAHWCNLDLITRAPESVCINCSQCVCMCAYINFSQI